MSRGSVRLAIALAASALAACVGPLAAEEQPSDAVSDGCIEERTPLAGETKSALGFSAADLARNLNGSHGGELTWSNGATTRLVIAASVSEMHHVRSRYDPAYHRDHPAAQCTDHARVTVRLELRTRDGNLNEVIERATLITRGEDQVYGSVDLDAADLVGSHIPVWRGSHCPVGLRVRLLFARDGSHGSLTDLLRAGSCGTEEGPIMAFAAGRWGMQWLNY